MKDKIIKQFNLPSYIKGKTFAEASKLIEAKFKDREDTISNQTKKELLERLAQAQESLKEPIENNPSNDFFLGGLTAGAGAAAGSAGGAGILGAMGGPLGIAATTLGPGLLKMGIGAIGNNKRKNEALEQEKNQDQLSFNNNMNDYKKGGYTNEYSGVGNVWSGFMDSLNFKIPNITGTSDDIHNPTYTNVSTINPKEVQKKIPSINKEVTMPEAMGLEESALNSLSNFKMPANINLNQNKDKTIVDKSLNWLGDNHSDILRYAPVAANALQLASIKKPGKETLDRLGNRYEKQYVDEAALLNSINNNFNDNYLVDSSGGSQSRYAANSRAAQLAKSKAISDAYMKASESNRNENRTAQQFNLGVDQFNIGQSNRENEINAQNMGAYNTEKSKLIGQIGTDIGNIGKEQKFKQMVKDSGLCYDSRGAYICGSGERVSEDQIQSMDTNENKYGGTIESTKLFSNYLDTLLNKKK